MFYSRKWVVKLVQKLFPFIILFRLPKVEESHGVNFINYCVDEKKGVIMCLSEASHSTAVKNAHKEAHGLVPSYVLTKGGGIIFTFLFDFTYQVLQRFRNAIFLSLLSIHKSDINILYLLKDISLTIELKTSTSSIMGLCAACSKEKNSLCGASN